MNARILALGFVLWTFVARGQGVAGRVTDAATGRALAGATVLRWQAGRTVDYAFTDAEGRYRLPARPSADSLTAVLLGYGRRRAVRTAGEVDFALTAEVVTMREVRIVGHRLSGAQDTLFYDVGRFADERDRSLKEALKRLPGVEVDDAGRISYNGRALDRFTVEGLDLSGGRYNLLSETLKVEDVACAEIIEHYQPIRALHDKVYSDRVALNIRLRERARNRWMWTAAAAGGYTADSPHALWSGRASALAIGRRQTLCLYEADNTGADLAASARRLTDVTGVGAGDEGAGGLFDRPSAPAWFSLPELQAPVGERRVRRNRSHHVGLNHLSKPSETRTVRLSADFLRDGFDQDATLHTVFRPDVRSSQYSRTRRRNDLWSAEWQVEENSEKRFFTQLLRVGGGRQKARSRLQNDLRQVNQTVERSSVEVEEAFRSVRHRGGHTWSCNSSLAGSFSPERLRVNREVTELPCAWIRTDHTLTWLRKYGPLTQSYGAGIAAEGLRITDLRQGRLTVTLRSHWEYARSRWTLRLTLPLRYRVQPGLSRLLFDPRLQAGLRSGYRSEWTVWASRSETPGNWGETYPRARQSDYRTFHAVAGCVPMRRDLFAGLSHRYKNPLSEFFFAGGVQWSRGRLRTLTDLTLEGDRYLYTELSASNLQRSLLLWTRWSKGIHACHLKLKTGLSVSWSSGRTSRQGAAAEWRDRTLTADPEVIYAPAWGELRWSARIGLTHRSWDRAEAEPLLNVRQSLRFTIDFGSVDCVAEAEHVHSELAGGRPEDTVLLDAALHLRRKKWRAELTLNNLLDRRSAQTTFFRSDGTDILRYTLRPRALLLGLRYSF